MNQTIKNQKLTYRYETHNYTSELTDNLYFLFKRFFFYIKINDKFK